MGFKFRNPKIWFLELWKIQIYSHYFYLSRHLFEYLIRFFTNHTTSLRLLVENTLEKRKWQNVRHEPRRGDELHRLITEGIIEGSRGGPTLKYIVQ